MFGLLKNKISSFINSLTGRKETGKEKAKEEPSKKEEELALPLPETQKEEAAEQEKKEPQEPQKEPQAKQEKKPKEEIDISRLGRKAEKEKRDISPKVGAVSAIKSIFTNEIEIGEAEISDLLEELELSLLEADVAYDVSVEMISLIRSKLIGMRIPKQRMAESVRQVIRQSLEEVMGSSKKFDFVERVKSLPKPAKILFVGPNGAGKTTTMAKLARLLMDAGLSVVFSASDTFRAAAIEQTEAHGKSLGVRVIKSKYGADPASVAFDAISYAKANSIDVVLIDSAGRQDTNVNLLAELSKISRVTKPDMKIYIGESIGGNSVIDQIRAFNQAIGIDGAILTKIDCDAKGGTAISIAKATGIPILFLGVGQGYGDLVPFEPRKIAAEIIGG
jgi:fused signal recognition particle receptor